MYSEKKGKKMKTLTDLGTYDGNAVQKIIEKEKPEKVFLFEPQKELNRRLKYLFQNNNKIKIIKAAATTKNGNTKLWHTKSGLTGSSIHKNRTGTINEHENIKTINFSEWTQKNLKQKDYNILNVSIEGEEYNLITQLIKTKQINKINEIYVEWNNNKIGISKEKHWKLIKQLKQKKFKINGRNDKYEDQPKNQNTFGLGLGLKERIKKEISCEIQQTIPKTTKIHHMVGIVICSRAKLGENIEIYPGVKIVEKIIHQGKKIEYQAPTIKNNVIIFSNACIIGEITIKENSIIGAGSVVTKNIPKNEVWAGNPAKKIGMVKTE